ncbi:MAG: hypothetical protein ACRDKY_12165 [Solirubrobacteraceae bacterium]
MPGQRRNLEVKAIDPDPPSTLEAALALGADDRGVLRQRDTYFHAVQGQLKLREAPPQQAELISYARTVMAGPRVSHYAALIDALRDALGVRVVGDSSSSRRSPRLRAVSRSSATVSRNCARRSASPTGASSRVATPTCCTEARS